MYQAIRGGLAGSAVLDAKVPLILDRNFVAGGRIDINMKDMTNVMDTAHRNWCANAIIKPITRDFPRIKGRWEIGR